MLSLSLPDSVENLEYEAFRECRSLTELSIPGSLENIGLMAFYFCSNLVSLTFGDGVKTIGYNAFFYGHELTSVEIPDSVTSIQEHAFGTCFNLTSVRLGRGVTNLSPRAFNYALALPAFQMAPGNPSYTVVDGVIFTKDLKKLVEFPCGKTGDYAFPDGVETIQAGSAAYSKPTAFRFPDSLSVIEDNAFFGCDQLHSISFGSALTNIGRDAFTYCDALTEFLVATNNPVFASVDGVLFNKDKTHLLACPGGMAGVYEVPAGVEEISANAFRYCRHLTCAVFPEGLKRIESNAFDGCSLLDTVILPSSVESVGHYAFGICPALSAVSLPEGLTMIGGLAFYRCSGLTSLVLPASVEEIGGSAFGDCSSLVTLCVPASWRGTSMLDRAQIPETCTVVYGGKWTCEVDAGGNATLTGAPEGVERLVVPPVVEGHPVTAIGAAAFSGRAELEEVILPTTLASIGESAFAGCGALAYLRLPEGVDSVGADAFSESGLSKLSVPGTWEGWNRLDGVALPDGCLVFYRGEPPGDPRYSDWSGGYGVAPDDLPADGDPDGDGATNGEEFIAGSNPLDDSDFLHLSIGVEGGKIDLAVSPLHGDRAYAYSGTDSLLSEADDWEPISAEELESLNTDSPLRFFKVQVGYPEAE